MDSSADCDQKADRQIALAEWHKAIAQVRANRMLRASHVKSGVRQMRQNSPRLSTRSPSETEQRIENDPNDIDNTVMLTLGCAEQSAPSAILFFGGDT